MKKLNVSGFSHVLLPLLVIGVIATIGTYVLTGSHADTPGPEVIKPKSISFSNQYLSVTPKTGQVNVDRGQPNTGLLPPGVDPVAADGYSVGFIIHNKTALAYRLEKTNNTASAGFALGPNNNLQPGQTQPVIVYADRYLPNPVPQTLSARLQYEITDSTAPGGVRWKIGPAISLTVFLTGQQPYTDYFHLSQLVGGCNLNRGQVNQSTGLITCTSTNVVIIATHATQFQLVPNPATPPTSGQGYIVAVTGQDPQQIFNLQPGQPGALYPYLARTKQPGNYNGSEIIRFREATGEMVNGPVVYYNITLAN